VALPKPKAAKKARRGASKGAAKRAAKSAPRSAGRKRRIASKTAAIARKPLTVRAADEIAHQLFRAYRRVEVSADSVLLEARSRGLLANSLEELRSLPLAKREALATTFIKSAKIWATGHGTSLGAAGVVTMAADIAALVAVNLRMIQHVALSYGVPPAAEKIDAWAIMLGALGEAVDIDAARMIPPKHAPAAVTRLVSDVASLFARRALRGTESAGRAVPIVGAVFGGLSNYAFTTEVGNRAREYYRSLAP